MFRGCNTCLFHDIKFGRVVSVFISTLFVIFTMLISGLNGYIPLYSAPFFGLEKVVAI